MFFLVVTAREGLVGEGLSVLNSKKGWTDGFRSLADFLIGNFNTKITFITQYQRFYCKPQLSSMGSDSESSFFVYLENVFNFFFIISYETRQNITRAL